jgi:small subunit ribosomal protein S21
LQVVVRDNNVDQALRALKKKLQREGVFREMKLRNYYEKPSEKKARQKAEAVRRARKLARKRAQREGVFREMKLRNYYEKPSEKKARQKAEAVRRARKLARKRAQREGGLPATPPAGAAAARPVRPERAF